MNYSRTNVITTAMALRFASNVDIPDFLRPIAKESILKPEFELGFLWLSTGIS